MRAARHFTLGLVLLYCVSIQAGRVCAEETPVAPPAAAPAGAADPAPLSLETLEQHARQAIANAVREARAFRDAAELSVMASLEDTEEWKHASFEAKNAAKKLNDARVLGDSDQKLKASAVNLQAQDRVQKLKRTAMANSEVYQRANALFEEISGAAHAPGGKVAGGSVPAPGPQVANVEPVPRATPDGGDISTAMKKGEMAVGMTLDQANIVANRPGELIKSDGDKSLYRWPIMGFRGVNVTYTTDILGHQHRQETPKLAVVGHMYAALRGGKLICFDTNEVGGWYAVK